MRQRIEYLEYKNRQLEFDMQVLKSKHKNKEEDKKKSSGPIAMVRDTEELQMLMHEMVNKRVQTICRSLVHQAKRICSSLERQ
jgi:hypothetical protein